MIDLIQGRETLTRIEYNYNSMSSLVGNGSDHGWACLPELWNHCIRGGSLISMKFAVQATYLSLGPVTEM